MKIFGIEVESIDAYTKELLDRTKKPIFVYRDIEYTQIENTNHFSVTVQGNLAMGPKTISCTADIDVDANLDINVNLSKVPYSLSFHNFGKQSKMGYGAFKKYAFSGHLSQATGRMSVKGVRIFGTSGSNTEITLSARADEVIVRHPTPTIKKKGYKVFVAISNFLFLGLENSAVRINNGIQISLDRFVITVDGIDFIFFRSPNYGECERGIKQSKNSRITSWVEVNLSSKKDLKKVLKVLDTVLELISISKGQFINWHFWKLTTKDNQILEERFLTRNHGPWSGNANEMIDNLKINGGLKKFVESSYTGYSQYGRAVDFSLFKGFVVAGYRSSIQEKVWSSWLAAEIIANAYLTEIMNQTGLNLTTMNLEQKLNRITNRSITNNYQFIDASLWRKVRVDLAKDLRNPLFHSGKLQMAPMTSYGRARYLHLIAMKLFFKIVGYTGDYLDITDDYKTKQMD